MHWRFVLTIYLISDLLLILTQQFISADSQRDEYTADREYWKTHLGITSVPTDIPADALEVYIFRNSITKIEANMFSELSQCERLDLHSNQISDIQPGAFQGLTSIITIDLSNNQISQLRPGIFEELKTVTELYLSHNQISELRPGTFEGLSALTLLYLSTNQISQLKPGIFSGLSSLTTLWLHQNQISELRQGTFNELLSLTELRLNNNNVERISPLIFCGLDSLQKLYLYDNKLTRLSADVFNHLPRPLMLGLYTRYSGHLELLICDSELCWLKKEEQQGTIKWYAYQGTEYSPRCAYGVDWDTWDCDETGNGVFPKFTMTKS